MGSKLSKENGHENFLQTIPHTKIISERQINKASKKFEQIRLISEKNHMVLHKNLQTIAYQNVQFCSGSIRSLWRYFSGQLVIFVGHNDAEWARQDLGGVEPGVSIHHNYVT